MSTLLRDSPGSSQMALGPDAALGSPWRLIKLDSAPAPRTDVFGWVYRALIKSLDFVRLIRERCKTTLWGHLFPSSQGTGDDQVSGVVVGSRAQCNTRLMWPAPSCLRGLLDQTGLAGGEQFGHLGSVGREPRWAWPERGGCEEQT